MDEESIRVGAATPSSRPPNPQPLMNLTPSFDDAIAFARDLIRIPSPSGAEGDVARRVMDEMTALGIEDVRRDEVGNVIGKVAGTAGAPPVLLCSHLDVVGVGELSGWEHPPFSAEVTDGFLHGRGAMDIKGPLALQTHAAAALRGRAPGDVLVAHTVYEERGGWGMHHLMESGEIRPSAVVLGESTGGDIALGHRGRTEIEVILHGRAGHASAPREARNALGLLPEAIRAVEELAGAQEADEILGPSTLVPTEVTTLPQSRNVIPDRVVLALDCRLVPGVEPEGLIAELQERIDRRRRPNDQELRVEVRLSETELASYTGKVARWRFHTPGFLLSPDDPLIRAAASAVGRRDGSGPARARPWSFATDGGWSCGVHGIPSLGFAPGDEAHAHTNRERLSLDDARWCWERYPDLVLALQAELS